MHPEANLDMNPKYNSQISHAYSRPESTRKLTPSFFHKSLQYPFFLLLFLKNLLPMILCNKAKIRTVIFPTELLIAHSAFAGRSLSLT